MKLCKYCTGAILTGCADANDVQEHREAFFRVVKERNDERAKPPGQRDEARLLELTKRQLRLRIEACQAKKPRLLRSRDIYLQHPGRECCADCLRNMLDRYLYKERGMRAAVDDEP
ncbi:hypothetical protein ABPG75_012049 [Micractinium tetrahymenae]